MAESRIILNHKLIDEMNSHAASAYPEECCGLLIGEFERSNPSVKRLSRVKKMDNVFDLSERYHRYTIDPREFMQAESEAESNNEEIIGVYHSHPNAAPKPSLFDQSLAWPVLSYVVIEVTKSTPAGIKSWILSDDRSNFLAEEIEIREEI